MSDLQERNIGALWLQQGKKEYYTGHINGERVVMFATGDTGTKPSFRVYKEREREE